MCVTPAASIRLLRFLAFTLLLFASNPQADLFVCCWLQRPIIFHYAHRQGLQPPAYSSGSRSRGPGHSFSRLLPNRTGIHILEIGAGASASHSPEQPVSGQKAASSDCSASEEKACATATDDMQIALHAAADELTPEEIAKILRERGWAPPGAADTAALARCVRAVLDTELQALADAGNGGVDATTFSRNSHKQKLWDRLEALRRQLSTDCEEDCQSDCPAPRGVHTFSPAEAEAAHQRQYSWDSENYSLEEILNAPEADYRQAAKGPPSDTKLLALRDQLRREVVCLPALLTADEEAAACRCLASATASAAGGRFPVFHGLHSPRSEPVTCVRREYDAQLLLKDLRTTCRLLVGAGGPQAAGDLCGCPSTARQPAAAAAAVHAADGGLLSLASLFPDSADASELLGKVYCSRVEATARSDADDKRRGVVLLPGELPARDARVRNLADRIAFCCGSLVLVPELVAVGSASASCSRSQASSQQQTEGRLAAGLLLPYGMHALVARALLWLRLHEHAESLALVGLAEGGEHALTFASRTTAAANAEVTLTPSPQQGGNSGGISSCKKPPSPELRGLPLLDAVVALYPSAFNVEAVAASLEAPTLALFSEATEQGLQAARTAAVKNTAALFDAALRRHAKTRDHWVQNTPKASLPNAGPASKLVEDDVLLMATSWLSLWMGKRVPRQLDVVHDVKGFELSFRRFSRDS
ncbi:hypothetical protein Efla_007262 [Eimeria flavescens]